jgi:large subunit ribosomal protein L18Ae
MHKLKKSTGEVLAVNEVRERNINIVKNYGVLIRYNSRSGTHNMYKEYRDVSLCGAVEQMYAELAGRHRARFGSIHIVDTRIVPAGVRATNRYNPEIHGDDVPVAVKRPNVKQFLSSKVKFPLAHRIQRAPSKALRSTFNASRPTTFFS